MRNKLYIACSFFLLCFLVVIGRMFYITKNKGVEYEKRVLAQQRYDSISLPYRRGDILDRNGTQLATSEKVYNLILEPKHINADEESRKATVAALLRFFDLSQETVDEALADEESLYKVVLKKIKYEQVMPFNEFLESDEGKKVVGVWFEEEYLRYYPHNNLACHILGFTASGNVGNSGLEQYYNDELNGTDGRQYGYLNDDMTLERTVIPPINGNTLVTTIDANIQRIVEDTVANYMATTGAKNVSVLAMDPNNGEVLAMANSNIFNPNEPYKEEALWYQFGGSAEEQQAQVAALNDEQKLEALNKVWRNYIVSDSFEPGSTFKEFTIAGALEEDVLTGDETFVCDGYQVVYEGTKPISCHKRSGHGVVTVDQALMYSCNDALMQIAAKEGKETFYKYEQIFGFGAKTRIDLPGEADTSALVYKLDGLNPVELATCSFGQGQNVTMIQLATAFCSVINGGNLYEPHIMKQVVNAQGGIVATNDGTVLRKTISQETSQDIKRALYQTVEAGTGQKARIEGYTIGGKTGTAEKQPRGNGKYVISFIGFAPVEKPQVVVYVTVDEPNVEDQGNSGVASVIAHDVFQGILPYMNVFQSNTSKLEDNPEVGDEQPTPVETETIPEGNTGEAGTEAQTESTTSENQEGTTEAGATN